MRENKPAPYKSGGTQKAARDGRLGWRLRAYDPKNGRQVERVFWGTHKEAILALQAFEDEMSASKAAAPLDRSITVAEWAVTWLGDYQWHVKPRSGITGVKRRRPTVQKHRRMLEYAVRALGPDTKLRALTHDRVDEAIAGLRLRSGKDAASGTKDTVAATIRLMLAAAHQKGLIGSNPAEGIRSSWGVSERRSGLIASLPQVQSLAAAMDARPHHLLGDVVRVLAYTGLRWEELAALEIVDVDLARRTIFIHRTCTESGGRRVVADLTKTPAGAREILILDLAVEPLERLIAYARKHGSPLVACGVRGGYMSYSWWRKNLAEARVASAVDLTAHELRHTCASMLFAADANVEIVRNQMGHSSQKVTETVYRHVMRLDRSRLAKELSAAVGALEAMDVGIDDIRD